MVFNVTFNNILVIPWQSVLIMEETGIPSEQIKLNYMTLQEKDDNGLFCKFRVNDLLALAEVLMSMTNTVYKMLFEKKV